LLIIIPLISLLAVLVLQRAIRVTQFGSRYIISAIFVGLLTVGIYINTYTGSAYLIKSYKPSSTLNFLRTSSDKIIVGTHEFVNQSLVSIFNEKIFFLTKENEDLVSLGKALHKQGYQDFIYICYPYHPCHSSQKEPEILEFNVEGKTLKMEFYKLGNFNKNILYKSLITESKTTLEL
ncbi:MAG: hypothetical protein LDL41_10880, partial [Coleofasciculus sp. S288]|nr:hypothetical protein [Coleofasciculus sp. S288]